MKTDWRNLDGVRSLITEVMGCGVELMEVLLNRSPDRYRALTNRGGLNAQRPIIQWLLRRGSLGMADVGAKVHLAAGRCEYFNWKRVLGNNRVFVSPNQLLKLENGWQEVEAQG
jgi:hypothetical protein